MDDQNSLKAERRTLCQVLGKDPCNGSCNVHSYFSDRMDFYAKGVFNLQAGAPKEVLICYANPFFHDCAEKFSQDLDGRMEKYLQQVNPKIEITDKRLTQGIPSFDFTRSLKDMDRAQEQNPIESGKDPLGDPLKRYIEDRIKDRVQDSPLRFLVYAAEEDNSLAKKVVEKVLRSMSDELISLTHQKPAIRIEHGMALQFAGHYVIDLDYIIHEAIK